jgi:16S rRNA (adenine1518-N6/adenine1519-N6)-dimethyltransferase
MLRRHSLRAGRRHGQHFLVDPNTVRRIVRLAAVEPHETILEIGPGLGSLTLALAARARRVVCVEIDPAVAGALREVVDGVRNVEIVVGDAMRVDIDGLLGDEGRLVANLPYNVATPLILRVLEEGRSVRGGFVMVQRELGERWTAGPGTRAYGAVSVRVSYRAEARMAGEVPRSVFMPPPEVDSVLVAFARRREPPFAVDDEEAFLRFVRDAFGHRRKTLRNALAAAGHDRGVVERALVAVGLPPAARAEQVSPGGFAELYRRTRG